MRRGAAHVFALAFAGASALASAPAPAAAEGAAPRVSGTAEVEWALGRSGEAQKLEGILLPQLEAELGERFDLVAIGRLRADAYDRLEPGRPSQPEIAPMTRRLELGTRVDAELRELYVEGKVGPTWLRLGKQQVVWGQADGLKVLDVVNPQDFREFILDDFDDSRIPLWTANVEVPVGPAELQLLWLPDPTVHDLPDSEEDAIFAFRAPRLVGPPPPPGVDVDVQQPERPNGTLRSSDLGARLSGRLGSWDLTANYLWHYDDVPTLRRQLLLVPGAAPRAIATPEYERAHVVGATATNSFGDLTLRLEAALTAPRWVPVRDPEDADGAASTGELAAVVGLDWYGFDETLVSLQLFPSLYTKDLDGPLRDRLDTNLTLLVRRELQNDRLLLEAIWIQNLDQRDGLLRPKLRYELRDDLSVYAGYDWFYGTEQGLFGQFDAADRFVVGFEWGFTAPGGEP